MRPLDFRGFLFLIYSTVISCSQGSDFSSKQESISDQVVPVFSFHHQEKRKLPTTGEQEIIHALLTESPIVEGLSSQDLSLERTSSSPWGYAKRFQQFYLGKPVVGAELVLTFATNNHLQSVNNSLVAPDVLSKLSVDFNVEDALSVATELLPTTQKISLEKSDTSYSFVLHKFFMGRVIQIKMEEENRHINFFVFRSENGELKSIAYDIQEPLPENKVPLTKGHINIYANTGSVLCSAITLGEFVAFDHIFEYGDFHPDNVLGGDGTVTLDTVFAQFERTLGYYEDHFQRHSYDNLGAPLKVGLNCVGLLEMFFGNAIFDNTVEAFKFPLVLPFSGMRPFYYALDVVAHEYTHAVIHKTSNLAYQGSSGALNEHLADFFGELIQQNNEKVSIPYVIGESLMVSKPLLGEEKKFFRSMEDPHLSSPVQPANLNEIEEKYNLNSCIPDSSNDNCGNHILSGIPNKALVLLLKTFGTDSLEKIVYRVMVDRLRSYSDFEDYKNQLVHECNLQLADAVRCQSIAAAFQQVGVD